MDSKVQLFLIKVYVFPPISTAPYLFTILICFSCQIIFKYEVEILCFIKEEFFGVLWDIKPGVYMVLDDSPVPLSEYTGPSG